MMFFVTLFHWGVIMLVVSASAAHLSPLDHILANYSTYVRPDSGTKNPIKVTVGFGLVIMENHEERRQVFISQGVLKMSWKDKTLRWSKDDFNVSRIIIPAEKLWIPDLVILNDIRNFGNLPIDGVSAVLYHSGDVTMDIGGRRETYCRVDVSKFPFDTQVCTISVSQWASEDSEISLVPESPHIDLSQYQGNNGEYSIGSTVVDTSNFRGRIQIHFKVTFTRKSLYYVQLCVIPVILLSVLNLATFLIPAESGEKMTLAVSVFLSYAVFLTIIYGFLPEMSDSISLYGVYLTVMLSLKVLTLLFTVGVLNVHYTRSNIPVPAWLGRLVFHIRCIRGNMYPTPDTEIKLVKWHDVADVLDRVLFGVFATVTVFVSTLFFYYLNT